MDDKQATTKKTKIILVSTSDLWASSARTVLATMPNLELLEPAYGSLSAYQLVFEQQPHVLVIDDTLPFEEVLWLLNRIRSENIPLYFIAMLPTTRLRQVALAAGVDSVILHSGSTRQLEMAVLAAQKQLKLPD